MTYNTLMEVTGARGHQCFNLQEGGQGFCLIALISSAWRTIIGPPSIPQITASAAPLKCNTDNHEQIHVLHGGTEQIYPSPQEHVDCSLNEQPITTTHCKGEGTEHPDHQQLEPAVMPWRWRSHGDGKTATGNTVVPTSIPSHHQARSNHVIE